MAAGERGKAIEEAVAGFRRASEERQRAFDVSQGRIETQTQAQRAQLRAQIQAEQAQLQAQQVQIPAQLQAQIRAEQAQLQTQRGQLRTDIGRQRELTEAGFDPFIQAGTGALQDVQRGATVGGLDERIAQILGTGAFQGLREERFGDINRQLASAGLSRSGLGLEEIANISPDLAFQIENQLFGRARDLSNVGFQGVGQQAGLATDLTGLEARLGAQLGAQGAQLGAQGAQLGAQLAARTGIQGAQIGAQAAGLEAQLGGRRTGLEAQLRAQLGQQLAGDVLGIGQAQSQGRLGALQAKEARTSELLGLGGQLLGTVAGGPIGGALAKRFIGGVGGGGGIPSGGGIGFGLRQPGGDFFSTGISTGASGF